MRLLPAKFGKIESNYAKAVSVGIVHSRIVLFDSHGDVIDISSPLSRFRLKRTAAKISRSI